MILRSLTAEPVFVISGPSGVGKGTVIQALLQTQPQLKMSTSATTRAPRPGELDGVHYYFVSDSDFDRWIAEGQFLEWATVHGNRYGTLRRDIVEKQKSGTVLIEVDVQGARAIREADVPQHSVFIMPPSWEALETRLRGRHTESETDLNRRLTGAKAEMEYAGEYDDVVVNDLVENSVQSISRIISSYARQNKKE